MTGWYATAIIVISLLLVLWAGILLVIKRQPDLILACGGVQMVGSDRDFARAEFVGYLFACLVVLPAAFLWARGERSRAGLVVIAVAYLLLPILILRVQQVWAGNNVQ